MKYIKLYENFNQKEKESISYSIICYQGEEMEVAIGVIPTEEALEIQAVVESDMDEDTQKFEVFSYTPDILYIHHTSEEGDFIEITDPDLDPSEYEVYVDGSESHETELDEIDEDFMGRLFKVPPKETIVTLGGGLNEVETIPHYSMEFVEWVNGLGIEGNNWAPRIKWVRIK